MIQPAEIARLAHRLGLGDKTIEKDYALTWTLLAIAHSPLRDHLAFKGGTALKKAYVPEYRFSEDLDFTLLGEISNDELVSEVLLFPLVEAPLRVTYSDCRLRDQTLRVYSTEEILAEKLCALLGRTEPRDLYDVHFILEHDLADAQAVSQRLDDKMARNKVNRTDLAGVLIRKQETLRRLWAPRLQGQMPDLPHLDSVIRETNRWLRKSGLAGE